jgi:hypothetical protein
VVLEAAGDFLLAVAASRVRLHAHEAGGFVFLPVGKPGDILVMDF